MKGRRGKHLMRKRGELIERPFAHMHETGGMRRTHLRHHDNIFKRLLIHAAGANLCLLMRTLVGVGTPRSLQGRRGLVSQIVQALIDVLAALVAWWTRRRRLLAILGMPSGAGSTSWPDLSAGVLGLHADVRPAFTTGC